MNANQAKALSEATRGFVFDHEYKGGEWMFRAVETAETIEQYVESSTQWSVRCAPHFGEIAGMKFVSWRNMQGRPGQPRASLTVLDFGDHRVAIHDCDLADYE